MPTDSTLATIIGSAGASVLVGTGVLIDRYVKLRKQLSEVKSSESQAKRDIAQDETDTGSLKLLLESASQWKKQYEASVVRETRNRRLLAISDAKMRRFIKQAADDRAEDRRKIESLVRRIEALENENQLLKAQIGGRRKEDMT
ncbi:hypothetical protein A9R05_05600 [Burkholderia sp. KK1]|nr:hypothetical protein A9R05_05600 [Burkholderia sp. KK1]